MTTEQECLDQWQRDRDFGTARHAIFEAYIQRVPDFESWNWMPDRVRYIIKDVKSVWHFLPSGFLRWWASHPTFVPYRVEWSILYRDPVTGYPHYGQPDLAVLCTATMTLHVCDWKNTRAYSSAKSEKGIHPRTWRISATKPNMYAMQIRVYSSILASTYALPYPIGCGYIVNFDPEKDDGFEETKVELEDYTASGSVFSDFPWDENDHKHRHFDIKSTGGCPVVPFDDPRAMKGGPTRAGFHMSRCVVPPDMKLPVTDIWTGTAYVKEGRYNLEDDSPFAPPIRHWGAGNWAIAARYEEWLLDKEQSDVLATIVPKLYGKNLPCFCCYDPDTECQCHASVLARYANLLGQKLIKIRSDTNDIATYFNVQS